MKTTGIVLLVLGGLSFIGALAALSQGRNILSGPIIFIVIGAFLISRANKKKEEEEKKKQWAEGNSSNDQKS
jgi:hypothetical protein